MRVLSRSSGFSLVELLTVIAIIAILAAIIFPVMGMVKERARENQCMTNLHQIVMALQMFKQDNRRYPEVLSVTVEKDGSGNLKLFENCTEGKYLFKEYVTNYQEFHCPSSKITNSRDYATYAIRPREPVKVYAYDSYDYGLPTYETESESTSPPYKVYKYPEPHYMISWASSPDQIMSQSGLLPYPTNEPNDPEAAQRDYERQLKFRNPPGDTLVTWCSYHLARGRVNAVFLNGQVDSFPAEDVQQCKWRLRQKKK